MEVDCEKALSLYEEALNDVRSAILFHVETFGESIVERDDFITADKQV